VVHLSDSGLRYGEILTQANSRETLDAIVVVVAATVGGAVLTDDLSDLRPLGAAAGVRVLALRHA